MRSSRIGACVLAGSIVLLGVPGFAQTADEDVVAQPAPAAQPAQPAASLIGGTLTGPSPSAVPTAAQGAWWTPPPLAPRPIAQPVAVTGDGYVPTPESFTGGRPHCADTHMVARVFAESITATGAVVGTGMLVAFLANSTDNFGTFLLTVLGGATAYIVLTPLAVHGVARNFGGNGKVWAALLGGLLLPVIGHVIAYEISHEPECDAQGRSVHARGGAPIAMAGEEHGPRWMPVVAPTGQGGAVMGLTVSF